MKHFCLLIAMAATLLMPIAVFAGQASAVNVISDCSSGNLSGSDVCKDFKQGQGSNNDPVISALKVAIQVLAIVIGIAAVIGVVVSGLRLAVSGGDSGSVASARSGLVYSLVGLAVAILAQLIVVFILNKLNL